MSTGFYGLDHPNPNKAQFNRVRRNPNGKVSGTIVIHTAENAADLTLPDDGAEAVARYLSSRNTYGSYHTLIDSDGILPYVPISYEAFHETSTNHWAIGLSFALRTTDWRSAPADFIERMYRNGAAAAAATLAQIQSDYGIAVPLKRITRSDALNRKPGFIGHGDIDTGRRSDPGKDFDWNRFFQYIAEAQGGTAPAPTPPHPVATNPFGRPILKDDGMNGPATVSEMQASLGTPVDGVVSQPTSQFTFALQKWLNARGYTDSQGRRLVEDAKGFYQNNVKATVKTNTQYAFQRYLATTPEGQAAGLRPDGMFSHPSASIVVAQRLANRGGLFR